MSTRILRSLIRGDSAGDTLPRDVAYALRYDCSWGSPTIAATVSSLVSSPSEALRRIDSLISDVEGSPLFLPPRPPYYRPSRTIDAFVAGHIVRSGAFVHHVHSALFPGIHRWLFSLRRSCDLRDALDDVCALHGRTEGDSPPVGILSLDSCCLATVMSFLGERDLRSCSLVCRAFLAASRLPVAWANRSVSAIDGRRAVRLANSGAVTMCGKVYISNLTREIVDPLFRLQLPNVRSVSVAVPPAPDPEVAGAVAIGCPSLEEVFVSCIYPLRHAIDSVALIVAEFASFRCGLRCLRVACKAGNLGPLASVLPWFVSLEELSLECDDPGCQAALFSTAMAAAKRLASLDVKGPLDGPFLQFLLDCEDGPKSLRSLSVTITRDVDYSLGLGKASAEAFFSALPLLDRLSVVVGYDPMPSLEVLYCRDIVGEPPAVLHHRCLCRGYVVSPQLIAGLPPLRWLRLCNETVCDGLPQRESIRDVVRELSMALAKSSETLCGLEIYQDRPFDSSIWSVISEFKSLKRLLLHAPCALPQPTVFLPHLEVLSLFEATNKMCTTVTSAAPNIRTLIVREEYLDAKRYTRITDAVVDALLACKRLKKLSLGSFVNPLSKEATDRITETLFQRDGEYGSSVFAIFIPSRIADECQVLHAS